MRPRPACAAACSLPTWWSAADLRGVRLCGPGVAALARLPGTTILRVGRSTHGCWLVSTLVRRVASASARLGESAHAPLFLPSGMASVALAPAQYGVRSAQHHTQSLRPRVNRFHASQHAFVRTCVHHTVGVSATFVYP
jgi:hypothetical protein